VTTPADAVAAAIERAFGANEYPGDAWILGSAEGCEPFDEVDPFRAHHDWRSLDAAFLDGHHAALSFFSEAGFRYYLPAYLLADLRDQLKTADPVFHLTHGFRDLSVSDAVGDRRFELRTGRGAFINPRRFGAMTFQDYARYRLSVFTREEAEAVVAYLECVREVETRRFSRSDIDAALESFWRERARSGPQTAELTRHLDAQAAWLAARTRTGGDTP
jgi:hypothetical protein